MIQALGVFGHSLLPGSPAAMSALAITLFSAKWMIVMDVGSTCVFLAWDSVATTWST